MARESRKVWAERIRRWSRSGLSGAEFAAREGVKEATLRHWKWQMGRQQVPAFMEIAAVAAAEPFEAEAFELVFQDGRRLRIPSTFEEAGLRRLLRVLEER